MSLPKRVSMIMSLCLLAVTSGLSAQFLSPDDPVKIPAPAEIPAPPAEPSKPQATPAAPVEAPASVPAAISVPAANAYFADIAAYGREKNIILTWHLVSGRAIDKRIQIYRFSEQPRVIHDISRGTLIAKISGEINLFEDVPPERGAYYYGIFLETGKGLEPAAFTLSRNLVGPVGFQMAQGALPNRTEVTAVAPAPVTPAASFESNETVPETEMEPATKRPASSINAVIRKTYLRGDYQGAIKRLKPYVKDPEPRVRAKAIFYIGLARFHRDEFERAQRYFEHPLVKKYYRRNAEFWITKTTENLR